VKFEIDREMEIPENLIEKLRGQAPLSEKMERLTDEQLEVIYEQKWFKLFVPPEFNGLNLSLPDGLILEESLAKIDGSLGWTVTLCSGATMFIGYLNHGIAKELFYDMKVCFGGSGRASGKAEIIQDGYLISGKWQYATGASHNTVFTANCELVENNKTLLNEAGVPVVKSFMFLRQEVKLAQDWEAMGLKATSSDTFSVKELKVKKDRAFEINTQCTTLDNLIYRVPFKQFAETTLAVNTLGMTLRFLELSNEILTKKQTTGRDQSQTSTETHKVLLLNAKRELFELKKSFYAEVNKSWLQLEVTNVIEEDLLEIISIRSRKLVKNSLKWVSQLYPYCGMSAARPSEEINRVWRNIFTASQHSIFL
jgi:indole-3-acetate monooxygenase